MKIKVKLLIGICLLLFISCGGNSEKNEQVNIPDDNDSITTPEGNKIKVIAHKGAWKEFDLPENSIASLKKSIEIGIDITEADIKITKDGQVVIYHDDKVKGEYIKDLDYAELLEYKMGNDEPIPLLSDFLEIIVESDHELWVDVKSLSDDAGGNSWSIMAGEEAAKIIREYNAEKNVAYIVGRKAVLDKMIAAVKGEWDIAYMNTEYTPEDFLKQGYKWANFELSKFYENEVVLNDYLEKKIRASIYTVNKEKEMDWFIKQGRIYGITTDYPQKLMSMLKEE